MKLKRKRLRKRWTKPTGTENRRPHFCKSVIRRSYTRFASTGWRRTKTHTSYLQAPRFQFTKEKGRQSSPPLTLLRTYDLSCANCFLTSSASGYLGSIFKTRSKCCLASVGCSDLA